MYGTFHINVESINYVVHVGKAVRFRITAVDYDNKPISTAVHVQLAYRLYVNGKTETVDGDNLDLQTDAEGHAAGSLPVKLFLYSSAALLATAKAVAPGTRDVNDEGYIWVMGAHVVADDYGSDSQSPAACRQEELRPRRQRAPQPRLRSRRLPCADHYHRQYADQARAHEQRRQNTLLRPAHHCGIATQPHRRRHLP
jgi:hypothetical protein